MVATHLSNRRHFIFRGTPVSGHASQHKSHAEGHLNWHGKKGKGVQYWDYKHKNKKPHQKYHYDAHYGHY